MYRILQFVSNKFANSMYSETANVKDKKHIHSACGICDALIPSYRVINDTYVHKVESCYMTYIKNWLLKGELCNLHQVLVHITTNDVVI